MKVIVCTTVGVENISSLLVFARSSEVSGVRGVLCVPGVVLFNKVSIKFFYLKTYYFFF